MLGYAAFYSENTKKIQFKKINQEVVTLGERDLFVKIEAVSVNPIDYKVASSLVGKPHEDRVLGWDAAGIVVDVGEGVKNFRIGQNVYYAGSLERPGTNSEYHVVDERIVGNMPKNLSYKDAAAIPLTAITAYEALFERLQISKINNIKAKKVLLIGAAGGVGSIAIQLLKELTTATVIATASRPESMEWIKSLGVDYTINHNNDFSSQLENYGFKEVDYIFCINGLGMHFEKIVQVIKPFGKICAIDDPDILVNLLLLKRKSVTFAWEMVFTHSLYQTEDMIKQHYLLNEVSKLIEGNKIRTTVGLDLGELNESGLQKAHELLMNRKVIGKLVLGSNN